MTVVRTVQEQYSHGWRYTWKVSINDYAKCIEEIRYMEENQSSRPAGAVVVGCGHADVFV